MDKEDCLSVLRLRIKGLQEAKFLLEIFGADDACQRVEWKIADLMRRYREMTEENYGSTGRS
jgi:hypothetical protein